ncbi:hypothetical protein Leryth_022127 [Lithospermum erythrorhizon]|nr:hypothetical protein Leryth_022127 [Lithospermum erythrorhizon]
MLKLIPRFALAFLNHWRGNMIKRRRSLVRERSERRYIFTPFLIPTMILGY